MFFCKNFNLKKNIKYRFGMLNNSVKYFFDKPKF